MIERLLLCGLVVGATLSALEPAPAATCRNAGAFGPWLEAFKQEALAQKISQRAIAAAGPGTKRQTLNETVRDFLGRRPLDAELNRETFVTLGVEYLEAAGRADGEAGTGGSA